MAPKQATLGYVKPAQTTIGWVEHTAKMLPENPAAFPQRAHPRRWNLAILLPGVAIARKDVAPRHGAPWFHAGGR